MAQRVISGLTVEIGAETKGFQDALKEIDRVSKNIANDLKTVSQSMKIDPGDAESYADKMKLLGEAVDNSAKKVEIAKKAIEAINKDFKDGKVSPEAYEKSLKALNRQLESSEYEYNRAVNALDEYQRETKDATSSVKTETEAVDKVNKSYLLFYERTSKASDEQKELTDSVGQVNKSYDVYYEQTSKASDGQKQLTENVGKANKTYLAFYEQTSKASDGQRELTETVGDFGKSADDAGKKTISLGDLIKANLISDAIKTGLRSIADLAKSIGEAVWDTVKKISGALVDFTKESMSIAEENRQTIAKVGQVFGEYSQEIIDWSQNAATAVGRTSGEAQAAAATFGNMFAALGVGIVKTDAIDTNFVQMSIDLVQLAADVAAFNNTTTDEVLNAFQSGLAGTSRQLREYGIVINDAAVKQKALELGLVDTTKELTEGDKIIARYALMMEQAAHQTGQFARESDSATVQHQVYLALIKELQGQIGEKLIPVQAKLYSLVNELISNPAVQKFLSDCIDGIGRLADAFLKLFDDIETNDINGTFGDMLSQLTDKIMTFLPSVMEFGQEIIKMLVDGMNKYLPFILAEATPIITTLFNGLIANLPTIVQGGLQLVQTLCDAITNNVTLLAPVASSLVMDLVRFVLDNLPSVFQAAIDIVLEIANGIASALPDLIPSAISVIMQLVTTLLDNLPEIFETAHQLMIGLATGIIQSIPTIIQALPNIITSIVDFFIQSRITIANAGIDLLKALVSNLPEILASIVVGLAQIIAGIVNYFRDNKDDIIQAGKDLVLRLWDGIKSMASWFRDNFTSWISGIWNDIVSAFTGGGGSEEPQTGQVPPEDYISNPYSASSIYVPGSSRMSALSSGSNVTNSVNNSRNFSGGINIYVNSYGMNVAEVADELGSAVQQRLRMSGAMI